MLPSSWKCINRSDRTVGCVARGFENKMVKGGSSRQRVKKQISSKCNKLQLLDLNQLKNNKILSYNYYQNRNDDQGALALLMKSSMIRSKNGRWKRKLTHLQEMLPLGYMLMKFRKDGPPLGIEFDSLPSGAFHYSGDSNSDITSAANQRVLKRRKISEFDNVDSQGCPKKSVPVKKYGIGKGLMTVWHATNSGAGCFPTGINFRCREATDRQANSICSRSLKRSVQETKKSRRQNLAAKLNTFGNKLRNRRMHDAVATKKTVVKHNKNEDSNKLQQAECNHSIKRLLSQECFNKSAVLVDDEELELRELQAGPNPLTCSAHLSSNGMHSCSLCKDLLARFPPSIVKMRQPFNVQPWDSSLEFVKKLFKAFRFLYSPAISVDMCAFTLDEFAQAFHDKDSLLLGKIHMAILKRFLSDVEMELRSGFLPHASKDCRFLAFLHWVKHQEFIVKFWNRSLNPLTWTEILHQVLVAAGFSSKQSHLQRDPLNKEDTRLAEYGLRPGTLKGALFSLLSEQGNNGMKVSEMANAFQVVELKLTNRIDELEHLISSTLSSDITLFEKISPSSYRLRINSSIAKGAGDLESDTDCGSVDDSGDSITKGKSDESDYSELDSARMSLSIVKHKGHQMNNDNVLVEYNEIDESHSGEVWVLGLMEGEYSDLSVEEKLNALVALVDLTSALSSTRMEDPVRVSTKGISTIPHHGGAKIKRSLVKQIKLHKTYYGQIADLDGMKEMNKSLEFLPVDCSLPASKSCRKENSSSDRNGLFGLSYSKPMEEGGLNGHPLQSILLGYDRRFNRYWLFLGPCNMNDPGHKRIYFESSEDGHWEVIDTEEALCALLSVLDSRGAREACLLASLEKREAFLRRAMSMKIGTDDEIRQSTQSEHSDINSTDGSPTSIVDNNLSLSDTAKGSLVSAGAIALDVARKGEDEKHNWNHCQAFDAWIWEYFYSCLNSVKYGKRSYLDSLTRCACCHDLYWRDEKHCKICHATFELDFDLEEKYAIHVATCKEKEGGNGTFTSYKVLPSQLQSLKAALHAIEAVMPKDALVSAWTTSTRKLWVKRLRRASSLPELLQVLTSFVGAINEDWLCEFGNDEGPCTALDEIVVFFPTMPQTTSAVALWLVKLDALIAPYLKRVQSRKNQSKNNW